jgi:hypothetical protein
MDDERVKRLKLFDFNNRPWNDGAMEYLKRKADEKAGRQAKWDKNLLLTIYGGTAIITGMVIALIILYMGGRI